MTARALITRSGGTYADNCARVVNHRSWARRRASLALDCARKHRMAPSHPRLPFGTARYSARMHMVASGPAHWGGTGDRLCGCVLRVDRFIKRPHSVALRKLTTGAWTSAPRLCHLTHLRLREIEHRSSDFCTHHFNCCSHSHLYLSVSRRNKSVLLGKDLGPTSDDGVEASERRRICS